MTHARLALACLFVLASGGGCRGPLDRSLDDLIAQRSGEIEAQTPRSIANLGRDGGREGTMDRIPATTNPGADSLRYQPAAEAEDMATKLAAYAAADSESDLPEAMAITFEGALELAQQSGRDFRSAEEAYLLSAIRLLIERHQWSPRLFNDTAFSLDGAADEGNFDHTLSIINTLRVTQRLPFGGSVEARWITRATDQLRENATEGYTSSSDLVLSGNVPLLRGFGGVARESRVQAERNLVYSARTFERFRRSLLVDVAADYFDLLTTRARITNQVRDLESQQRRNDETISKVTAGRLDPFQRDITANAVRQSEARLANLRESYIFQLQRFKIRLGLDPVTPIRIAELEFDLASPSVHPDEAAALALDYRLDLQNERDQLLDTQRQIANARNGLLPELDLDASLGTGSDPDNTTGGFTIDPNEMDYAISLNLGLPLDRTTERLNLRTALIRRDRAQRDYEETRDNIVISARQAVRQIDLARFQLELAEEQIEINRRGLRALELRDDADPQSILDRQDALLNAENSRDQNRTDLRNSILDYLLQTGQLRVSQGGTFESLPGMSTTPIEPDEPTDGEPQQDNADAEANP
ncbi:MAG: outer membrane protein TolC [Phycisphaerales bacterium]|jgi:outer membrane protein TolC